MAIKLIRTMPDPILAQATRPVEDFDRNMRKTVDDLFETHYDQSNCAGLAANQIGYEQSIVVIDFSEKKNEPLCLINPKIIHREGEVFEPEACMSLPGGIVATVKRSKIIKVEALDPDGKQIQLTADGFLSRCIQHELDHLMGQLFIDRISRIKRSILVSKYAKLQKKQARS
jgi:peptide deformylase